MLERRQLIAQHPTIVLGAIPSGEAALHEVYTYLLADYLPTRYPTLFTLLTQGGDGDSSSSSSSGAPTTLFHNTITGRTFPISNNKAAAAADGAKVSTSSLDPKEMLAILGETVDEDFFLLQQTPAGHRSVAYVCCYCSGFDPSAKLDKLLAEIHEPVPSYHKIGPSMERFFGRVEVGRNVKRVNVSKISQ